MENYMLATVWNYVFFMLLLISIIVCIVSIASETAKLLSDAYVFWLLSALICGLVCIGTIAIVNSDKVESQMGGKPKGQSPVKGDVFKRLADFSTSEGHHIATLIKDMEQSEVSLQANIGELSKTLEAFGRKVDDDPEFISWNRKLASLKTDRAQLKGKLKEAFIWSEKFRLSPSAEHKAELSARITECNTLATELAGRYRDLFELKSTG